MFKDNHTIFKFNILIIKTTYR